MIYMMLIATGALMAHLELQSWFASCFTSCSMSVAAKDPLPSKIMYIPVPQRWVQTESDGLPFIGKKRKEREERVRKRVNKAHRIVHCSIAS